MRRINSWKRSMRAKESKETKIEKKEKVMNQEEMDDVNLYIPPIDVSVTIHAIDEINVAENSFDADITVRLDWEDPSIKFLHLYKTNNVKQKQDIRRDGKCC